MFMHGILRPSPDELWLDVDRSTSSILRKPTSSRRPFMRIVKTITSEQVKNIQFRLKLIWGVSGAGGVPGSEHGEG